MTATSPHPLVAFYRDGATDDRNRTLQEILAWDDERLESIHDYIQWLFPLRERSGANPTAPVLDPHAIELFHASPEMRGRLRLAFDRMMRFYGLQWVRGSLERGPNFAERSGMWLRLLNHNHLRITRILRSTGLLGLKEESNALFAALEAIYLDYSGSITPRTFAYWVEAVERGE